MTNTIYTGLDLIEQRWPTSLNGAKVGLVVHPASVNRHLEHASQLFQRSKRCTLAALFGPQHGIRGETQDNMIEWEGFTDPQTQLPIYSLYGATRTPTPEMLEAIDVLVIDLQDVGARYYTFIWTMECCMQACLARNIPVVVLDRPNPIGGERIEGNLLNMAYTSFVGQRPLPIRHGMTIGEIARYLKNHFYPQLELHVIAMEGWRRAMYFDDTGLPWVMPSPNMPTVSTAEVYPGMCLLEGTRLSEGRGTTRPFELFGAPYIDPYSLVKRLDSFNLPGVSFRPLFFLPTFQKYAGQLCGGAQIHIVQRHQFMPVKTAVAILKAVRELYPQQPLWSNPPYEYEQVKLPIDILSGSDQLRLAIDNGSDLECATNTWQSDCHSFETTTRQGALIYT